MCPIRQALAAGQQQGKTVWSPEGEYLLSERLDVSAVSLRCAGPWFSVLRGLNGKGGLNGVAGAIVQTQASRAG